LIAGGAKKNFFLPPPLPTSLAFVTEAPTTFFRPLFTFPISAELLSSTRDEFPPPPKAIRTQESFVLIRWRCCPSALLPSSRPSSVFPWKRSILGDMPSSVSREICLAISDACRERWTLSSMFFQILLRFFDIYFHRDWRSVAVCFAYSPLLLDHAWFSASDLAHLCDRLRRFVSIFSQHVFLLSAGHRHMTAPSLPLFAWIPSIGRIPFLNFFPLFCILPVPTSPRD